MRQYASYGDPNPVDLERQRRNKMGRPLNKRNFGDTSGSGQQISVTADTGGGSGSGPRLERCVLKIAARELEMTHRAPLCEDW